MSSTLRAICIKETCSLLMRGVFDKWQDNPFCTMPHSVVQEILSSMFSAGSELNGARSARSHLLLTSGRIQRVDLSHTKDLTQEEYAMLFRFLAHNCQNLQTLLLPCCYMGCGRWKGSDEEQALRKLLQNCFKLEELHSNIYFDPNDLQKCRMLRRLKLHFFPESFKDFSNRVTPDLLQCLVSLEVFARCHTLSLPRYTSKSTRSVTVTALDIRPRLTSLGFLDSAMAINKICCRDERPRHFQLRRCYWATDEDIAEFEYCEAIRVAAVACSLLNVLVIRVDYAGCLQHLKVLEKLTSLDIDFRNCKDEYDQEFYSLLYEAGPKLQHLSILGPRGKMLSLNMICDNCRNLITLRLDCEITVNEFSKILHLKRLTVTNCFRNCLYFLLSNCIDLEVLCLRHCEPLRDDLLKEILKQNSLLKLEVALIYLSSLSQSGLKSFVLSAEKLKKLSVGTPFLYEGEVMRLVRDLNPNVVCLPNQDFFELEKEEFPLTCWL